MNIAEFSIQKKVITGTLTVVLLVLGYFSYQGLPRLEDPEFTIKDAVVITHYPGASAQEVEKEVTEKIEKAIQELGQLKRVESYSSRGLSTVKVKIKDEYGADRLAQVWDEMRRKISDVQTELPPGTQPSIVNDDFGDVYGIYYALTGPEYSMAELKKTAELLKRELLVAADVKKITFTGIIDEAVFVEMSKAKMAAMDITQKEIFDALQAKNLPVDAGRIKIGTEYIFIQPTGLYKSEKDFGDLLISSKGGKLIYLKDVANISRDYADPPRAMLRMNGNPAIGIGISTIMGGNAVTMGDAVEARIEELLPQIPLGMELEVISMQSETVKAAISGFIINLLEAVLIVVIILLFFMGLRSGLIIGFILLLTISITFVFMDYFQITLERISLGALIIALGMLVDNAIVIVDGMKVRMEQGMDGLEAAKQVVGQNSTPLLGATAVAILAFASIGGMTNNTGEYTRSLYYVILIALSLSWLTAVTTTPLITMKYILSKKAKKGGGDGNQEQYGGKFYQKYRDLVTVAIRFRYVTIGIVVGMFVVSMVGFQYVDSMFFPPSTTPQFIIEIQFREGTHIRETEKNVKRIERFLQEFEGITDVAAAIGEGHQRFILTYTIPVDIGSHYTTFLVSVDDFDRIETIFQPVQSGLEEIFPDAVINVKKFTLGPGEGGKIQLRINGPDPKVLRSLSNRVLSIMRAEKDAKAIRTEWGEQVKIVVPILAEDRARRLGISRPMVAEAIKSNFEGTRTGVYREGIELIPIIARAPEYERITMENLRDLHIYSPTAGRDVPMMQVVRGLETEMEDARISRWHRRSMIKIHCDAREGLSSALLARLKPRIEKELQVDLAVYSGKSFKEGEDMYAGMNAGTIPIKYDDIIPIKDMPGYFIAWGGEAEDSADAVEQLAASIPIYFGMMILVVIFLFNAFKQPLIIWLTVPLSIIGVTLGLLLLDQPFGFMAVLGLMSLSGMLIKNAIVLIDQIDIEIASGKDHFHSIIDSGVSRLRPVSLAAITTMMGMIPLFLDAFFVSMAVTIVFGLGFATVLTLVFVPVLYATFFKVAAPKTSD